MKIMMICGSPRPQRSTSLYLLNALKDRLAEGNEVTLCRAPDKNKNDREAVERGLLNCEILLVACPLYVDTFPGSFIGVMEWIEQIREKGQPRTYLVINNGFYDARQNHIAAEMFWNWCEACGFEKGYAVCVGGGEMAQAAPLGHGPSANLGKAIDRLAADVREKKSGQTVYVEPNFPRFLYLQAAHIGWKKQARQNGLKASEIRRRIEIKKV